jgi:hypothetical protein
MHRTAASCLLVCLPACLPACLSLSVCVWCTPPQHAFGDQRWCLGLWCCGGGDREAAIAAVEAESYARQFALLRAFFDQVTPGSTNEDSCHAVFRSETGSSGGDRPRALPPSRWSALCARLESKYGESPVTMAAGLGPSKPPSYAARAAMGAGMCVRRH